MSGRSSTEVSELIETLWNVNVNSATFAPDPPCELIETLWNVNKTRWNSKKSNL